MIKKLCERFLVAFLMIMLVPSMSAASGKKRHAIRQVIGKVISINETTNKLVLSCRKVKHTIIFHNLNNVSVGDWAVAIVDEKGEAVELAGRNSKIAQCGKVDLIQTSEIKKAFVKNDMLYITNKNGRKKRTEIDKWTNATSPNKKTIVYAVGFYYWKEALVLITDNKGTVRHAIDVGHETGIRFLDDDITWVNDEVVELSGNINYTTNQYLLIDTKKGTLLRSYLVSGCALSWSPAKDKVALCSWYPPHTPEEYRSDDLMIDETPTIPIKGNSLIDYEIALDSIYPFESERTKEESERLVHKFKTDFLWSPDGNQLTFVDEMQQVGPNDENKILGRYLIIVNAFDKNTTKLPLPELLDKSINLPSDQKESVSWSKDGRFILLNNITFDTRERLFLKN